MKARELLTTASMLLLSSLPALANSATTVNAKADGYATACGDNTNPVFTSLDTTSSDIYTFNTLSCLARGIYEFELPAADPAKLVSATFKGTLTLGQNNLWFVGYAGNGVVELADATVNSSSTFSANFIGSAFLSGAVPQTFSVALDVAYVKTLLGSTLGLATRTIEAGGNETLLVASSESADPPVLVLEFADETANTPVGTNVTVAPAVSGSAGSVSVAFDSVQVAGETTVAVPSATPPPPSGFKLTNPAMLFDIQTTASFTGDVRVCLGWTEGQVVQEDKVTLWHLENDIWVDITDPDSRDGVNNVVCGVADSLSPFALFDVQYPFTGFFVPVENLPTTNAVRAGAALPVKFSLGGDFGLDIFAEGFPLSQQIRCDTLAPTDDVTETVTAGASRLTYDPESGQYTYVWKTDRGWSGCRELQLKLADGETYKARFTFRK